MPPVKLYFLSLFLLLSFASSGAQCNVNAGLNDTICDGQTQILTAVTTGGTPATYQWSIQGGANIGTGASINVTPTLTTTYQVIISGNGCNNDTDAVVIKVVALPNTPSISYNPTTAQCAPSAINFSTANQAGVTFHWNFGDGGTANGSSVSHSYNAASGGGTISYTVNVTATNNFGCTESATQNISVKQNPKAVLTDPINDFKFCGGGNANETVYDASVTGANSTYLINWGDASTNYTSSTAPSGISHTYQSGVYHLTYTVTGSNGCSNTQQITVYDITNPQIGAANPGNTQGCGPKTICFPLNTFSANDSSTTYSVNFGDGSPVQIYSHPPPDTVCHNYTITSCGQPNNAYTFTVIAGNGCDTSIATIYPVRVYTPPIAQFTANPNPGCVNSPITFTNNTIVGSNNNCDTTTLYTWNFGDGTSNVITPLKAAQNHTYAAGGIYTITLSAQNFCGTSPATQTVCIETPPSPSFTAIPITGCAPYIVNLTNTSIGLFQCDSITRLWTVSQTSSTCLQDSTNSFVFVSGTNNSSVNPVIRFNNQGTYTITLSLTNVCGTFTTPSQTITVKRKPEVTISGIPSFLCVGQSILPSANALSCLGTISQYAWSFPGGTPSSSNSLTPGTITYSTTGTFTVSLAVTNECGTVTVNTPITIQNIPVAVAGNNQSYCSGGSVQIGAAAVNGYTYAWSPGTGLSSTSVSNPTVTLPTIGTTVVSQTYTVTVTNQANCTGTASVTVTVYPPATVSAGPSVTICNVSTTTLAGSFGGGASSITWTSNNGGTFSNPNSTTSNYTPNIQSGAVILTITTNDPTGPCPAVNDSMVVTVVQPPTANTGPPQQICSGGSVQIGAPPQNGYTYSWSPAIGLSSTTVSNPSVSLSNNGNSVINQTYTLIVSAIGCSDTAHVTVSVYPPAIANAGVAANVCYGDSIQLNGIISGAATSATWSSLNGTFGNSSALNTYFHPSIASGTAVITLTTNTPAGPCPAATSTVNIIVNPIPIANAIPNQTVCEGSLTTAVSLTSQVNGATFSWSGTSPNGITNFPPSGTASSIPSFTPNNPNTTPGIITYTITPTANGCSGTPITFNFTVNPAPNITTVPSQTVCSGQSHTAVSFTSSVVNTTYSWSASTTAGVSVPITSGNTSIPAQVVTNTGTTNGTVTYTITPTANSCPGIPTTFVVTVYPVPTVNTIPPQTICSGGQTTLVAPSSSVGGATFTWTATASANTNGFTTSGNGNIPSQTINYTGVTQGTVTYTITPTANGCAGSPFNFVVTVYPIPTVTANLIIDTICSGTQTNISLSSNVAAATFSWTVIQPASVSGATGGTGNSIQQTLTNTSSAVQQVTFTVTPSINNCLGSPIVVTVWVYPGITVSFSPPHQLICSSGTSVLVNITSPTAGVAFTWASQANGVTGVTASGTNTIPAQTLGNLTNAPIDVVYLITANYAGCVTQNANDTITVNPIPTVTTNPLSQTVCEGTPTQIINLTSDVAGTTFTWSGSSANGITGFTPNGNTNTIPTQTLNNPNYTAGTVVYSITPTADGCPGSPVNYNIIVNPTPNIILPSDTAICNGNSTNPIPISSSVAGTNFSWTSIASAGISGNSPNGNGNIPVQTLLNINNSIGTVIYTITANASTCISTATYIISVNPSPTVIFSLPNQIICSGTSSTQVNLTSSTPGANISWTASVPAGITGASISGTTTIAAQNLTNTTFQPLTITYTAQAVTSGITCPGAISTYTITVNPLPDLSITPTLDTICSASQTNIQLSSDVAGTVFTWAVNFPPNISGQTPGTGNSIAQTLLSTDANPQTVIYSITTNAATCPGQSGSSSVIVYPSPTVQFSLSDQVICSGFATQAVQITSPTAGAVITWSATVPAAITGATLSGTTTIPIQTLTNSSNIPQQVLYNASVNFSVCPGLANTYTVTVNPTPHITNTDTLQTICSADLSNPIPLLSDVAGATFSWNGTGSANLSGFLPNGTTSTIPSQAISNSSNVSDTVLYVVIPTAAGCVGPPQEFQIAVNPRPIISLVPDTQVICTNNASVPIIITSNIATTTFTWSSASTFVSGGIPNGTGNTIPSQTLQNTSPQADTGFVVFTVVPTAAGCPGQSKNAFIQVNPTPVVDFAMNTNSGCSPLHVSFATNTLTFGNPDSLVFNWGDGTPNTILHPNLIQPIWSTITHIFSDASSNAITYTISLTANNDCGDTTVSQTVTVQPNTINAFFTPSATTGCEPLIVSFNDFSTGATFASWCFNYDLVNDTCLGNSEVVNPGTTVQNTFNAGSYVVALYITNGCSQDTAYQTIDVTASPTVNFTYNNNSCEHSPITFTEQSIAPSGSFLTSFNWQFGDGDSLSGNIVTHTYDSAGVYNACLKVTSSNGCANTQCYPLTILLKPIVNFSGYDTCVNTQPIQFTNASVGADFYQWNFGDGNTSVLTNPSNAYTTSGTFTVILIGSTNTCSDTISHPFIVYPAPIAGFDLPANYICGIPAQVPIINTSTGALGYNWNFGNNTFSTSVNPVATFAAGGNYYVTLTALNQFRCIDTIQHPIDIYPFPVINSVNIEPFEGCQPLQITVTANTSNGNLFLWNFGDGTSTVSTSLPTVSYTYTDTGTYSISLTAYSFLTCGDTVTLSDTVKVHIKPIANFDTLINSSGYPFDGTVDFINQSQNATSYIWNFGDGFNSIVLNPVHRYEEVDSFTVTLIASNIYCQDTISKTFFVIKKDLYVPNALAPDFGGSDTLVRIWKPIGMGIRDYRAQVFDKWGKLLWESSILIDTKPAEAWDGTYMGIPCPEDVYVWKVDAVFVDGEIWPGMKYKKDEGGGIKRIGSITLVR